MLDLDSGKWKVARSFMVMENKFPFRTANSMGKQIDLTRLDDGLREVEEIDSDTDMRRRRVMMK